MTRTGASSICIELASSEAAFAESKRARLFRVNREGAAPESAFGAQLVSWQLADHRHEHRCRNKMKIKR